ncbi:uncharacterized protein K444DRAFT_610387 [Hyaloscypha bicolor E]|uniref:Uncharacterized protein n=1 Tax=Hyaloscypha bicolor E TaxID=1095630 RepID=A0A2J6TH44_9HELO|nr:uncharacterized protein K444DRAFT_610387 [Hyaloscypha bicolor E]PMD62311.1 hypothetical protein K444DRAFT_610387 [Hyaloscypha bicolor E]
MALRFILTASALMLHVIAAPPQTQAPLFSSAKTAGSRGLSLDSARVNAPHIFNTVHSSMRQWGSSLNHNGMSLFPARIPNNTHLYHGTHTPNAVKGMDWLAFEIEHAEMFARAFPGRRPGGRPGKPGDPEHSGRPGEPGEGPSPPPFELTWAETVDGIRNIYDGDDEPDFSRGYLHIYRTTRPLTNLVYIDGMSAGKTTMGTLDTQDSLLRNMTDDDGGPAFGDFRRGQDLCDLGAKWGIEGFVRMEMGFEIIFCEFSDGLVLESARERPSDKNQSYETLPQLEVLRGASMRYPGITGQRLTLDYSGMVSAYWYDLNLTNPDPKRLDLPRLPASDLEGLGNMKADFKAAFEESSARSHVGNDWQGITDMIITRYSDRLQLMAGNNTSREIILSELAVLLNLYIDYGSFDIPMAIEKCTVHYLIAAVLETSADHMIHGALSTVANKICSTLFYVGQLLLEEETESGLTKSKSAIKSVIDYLDWTTWKECGKCGYDEICFVAIWPWGSMEDHKHPNCMKDEMLSRRQGYWDMGGGGRRPPTENETRSGADEL